MEAAIPADVREAALRLGAKWTREGHAYSSDALIGDFENEFPDAGVPSDRRIKRHYREIYAPGMLEATWKEIHDRTSGGAITLWRSVRIEGDPVEALSDGGLGIYWAYERDQAHAHDNASEATAYLLEGRVEPSAIDWIETLAAATQPDWCGESEVRLLPDAEVTLVSVHRREGWLRRGSREEEGEAVDVGDLAGAVFRAGREGAGPAP